MTEVALNPYSQQGWWEGSFAYETQFDSGWLQHLHFMMSIEKNYLVP